MSQLLFHLKTRKHFLLSINYITRFTTTKIQLITSITYFFYQKNPLINAIFSLPVNLPTRTHKHNRTFCSSSARRSDTRSCSCFCSRWCCTSVWCRILLWYAVSSSSSCCSRCLSSVTSESCVSSSRIFCCCIISAILLSYCCPSMASL